MRVYRVQTFTSVCSKMPTVEDAVLAAAASVIFAGHQERRPRRLWVRPFLKARAKYCGNDLLADINEDDRDPLSGKLRSDGSIKIFRGKASCDFEYLLTVIGHSLTSELDWACALVRAVLLCALCSCARCALAHAVLLCTPCSCAPCALVHAVLLCTLCSSSSRHHVVVVVTLMAVWIWCFFLTCYSLSEHSVTYW